MADRDTTSGVERRLPIAFIAAAVWCCVCWNFAGSVDSWGETRAFGGPIAFLRTDSLLDRAVGLMVTAPLLAAIWAWIVWPRVITVAIAIAGIYAWLAIGNWLEMIAAC